MRGCSTARRWPAGCRRRSSRRSRTSLPQHGRPPGLAIVLVGHESGIGGLRSQQAEGRSGCRVPGRPRTVAGDRFARRRARACRDAERQRRRTTASSCSRRCRKPWVPTPDRASSTPSRRRRTSTASRRRNVGRLVQGRPALVPCTPVGDHRAAARRKTIPIGRPSGVRDRPQRHCRQADGACCCCSAMRRSRSAIRRQPNLAAVCREADILVAAVGAAGLVTKEFVKPGATVIDVGVNTRDRSRSWPRDSFRTGTRGSRVSVSAARCWSAMSTPRWPRLPAR